MLYQLFIYPSVAKFVAPITLVRITAVRRFSFVAASFYWSNLTLRLIQLLWYADIDCTASFQLCDHANSTIRVPSTFGSKLCIFSEECFHSECKIVLLLVRLMDKYFNSNTLVPITMSHYSYRIKFSKQNFLCVCKTQYVLLLLITKKQFEATRYFRF